MSGGWVDWKSFTVVVKIISCATTVTTINAFVIENKSYKIGIDPPLLIYDNKFTTDADNLCTTNDIKFSIDLTS
jgi:hypothetical protein